MPPSRGFRDLAAIESVAKSGAAGESAGSGKARFTARRWAGSQNAACGSRATVWERLPPVHRANKANGQAGENPMGSGWVQAGFRLASTHPAWAMACFEIRSKFTPRKTPPSHGFRDLAAIESVAKSGAASKARVAARRSFRSSAEWAAGTRLPSGRGRA